jgi:hypothetical protein
VTDERERRMSALLGIMQTADAHAELLRGWTRWLALIVGAADDADELAGLQLTALDVADSCEQLATRFRHLSDRAMRQLDTVSRS